MKIVTKKTIKKECWHLDYSLIKWLNEHLKVYYNDANEYVNLSFHKFTYKGKKYTQEQIIVRMIEITNNLEKHYFDLEDDVYKLGDELFDLLKLVHWSMWW